MQDRFDLTDSILSLEGQYLANELSLNALVHRIEVLLEQSEALLIPERHQRAMNCVYVLEEINALVLDEGRSMRKEEHSRIAAELRMLASLVA